jgi:hypothetical protein
MQKYNANLTKNCYDQHLTSLYIQENAVKDLYQFNNTLMVSLYQNLVILFIIIIIIICTLL